MERAVFGIILEQSEDEQEAGRNVTTSQCRVKKKRKSTSGQRRDVSANSVSTSLKAMGPEIKGGSEKVWTRARKA